MNLNEWSEKIHKNAIEHGWWEEERHFGSLIALIHSELSEALEEYRNGRNKTWFNCEGCTKDECYRFPSECKQAKPEGIPIELADCIIRILDYCGREGIDIEKAIKIKHEYNKTRPYRHGGKKI